MSNYIVGINGELYHHGIKGMKWGVRRYQNKDGSLTPAGKKRLSDNAGWYMNPKRDDRRTKNRKAVSEQYVNEQNKLLRKLGDDRNSDKSIEAQAKLWNSFIDKYADATLKDFKYANSQAAKDYVKEFYDKDLLYKYDVVDTRTGKTIKKNVIADRETVDLHEMSDIDADGNILVNYKKKRNL